MKKIIVALALAILVPALTLAGLWLAGQSSTPARADPGVTTVAVDMIPGNGGPDASCPGAGNCDSFVGPIDSCVSIGLGADTPFDVILSGIDAGKDLKGFQYFMGFSQANLTITAQQHKTSPPAGPNGINIINRNPAPGTVSCAGMFGCLDTGEVTPDPPDSGIPPSPNVHDVFVADGQAAIKTIGPGSDDPNGGAGGVLSRYTIQCTGAAGIYTIGLNDSSTYTIGMKNAAAGNIWDIPGNGIDDDADTVVDDDLMKTGLIACGVPCPQPSDLKNLSAEVDISSASPAPLGIDNDGDTLVDEDPADGADNDSDGDIDEDLVDFRVGVDTAVNLIDVFHNNGPGTPVNVTLHASGTVPAGLNMSYHCQGNEKVVRNGVVLWDFNCPAGTVIWATPGQTWAVYVKYPAVPMSVDQIKTLNVDFRCLAPSMHSFTVTKEIMPTEPSVIDPDLGNNDGSFTATFNCVALDDIRVVQTMTVDPIDNDGDTLTWEDAKDSVDNDSDGDVDEDWPDQFTLGVPVTVDVDKAIDLVGTPDYQPISVVVNKYATVVNAAGIPYSSLPGYGTYGADCAVTPVMPAPAVVSGVNSTTDIPHSESFTLSCTKCGYRVDDDGDGLAADPIVDIDEDPADGVDNDADGMTDEDGTVCIAVVVVYNLVVPVDPHVIDTDLAGAGCIPAYPPSWPYCGDNADVDQHVLKGVLPWTSTFKVTIDEAGPANTTTYPTQAFDDDCLITLPCKRQIDYSVGAVGQNPQSPLAGQMTLTPKGPFTLTSGLNITTGSQVGVTDAVATVEPIFTMGCATPFPVSGLVLYDCALPSAMGEIPANPAPNDTPNATSALASWASWSTKLQSYVNVVQAKFPGAILIERKCNYTIVGTTAVPVNILVFDWAAGSKYIQTVVMLDPDNDNDGIINDLDPDDDGDTIRDAADLDYNGDGISNVAASPSAQCAPFQSKDLELGQSVAGPGGGGGQTLATCNVINTSPGHMFVGAFSRLDTGASMTQVDFSTCSGQNDVSVTKSDNLTPVVPISIPTTFPITITVTNGAVPTNIAMQVSIVSGPNCKADLVPAVGDTHTLTKIGDKWFSKLSWSEWFTTGQTKTLTRNYVLTCSSYTTAESLQIIVNGASSPWLPDPNIGNNQAENHPVASATDNDADDDTIINADDNCPVNVNPDQADNDDDGMGDVCDPDDDNDAILDNVDVCDFTPEDYDGSADTDGCPESNVSLVVDKDNPIEVNVSETTPFTVTARACNGDYGPTDLRFTELLKSDPDGCVAHWVCLPGDQCVEDIVLEDLDNDPLTPDVPVLYSQLEVVFPAVAPWNCREKVREYTVHCPTKCLHEDAIFLEESVAPEYPVLDPVVANNVDKQFIDVTAWANADVKLVGYEVHSAPASLNVGQPAHVILKKVLHNNGPYAGLTVSLSHYPTAPQGCTITPWNVPNAVAEMPVSVQTAVFEDWIVVCDAPSSHTFAWEDVIDVTGEHVRDPDDSNNSASVSLTLPVLATTTVSAAINIQDIPELFKVSETKAFTVYKTLSNTGPFGPIHPDVDQVLTPPADCNLSFNVTNALLAKVDDLAITLGGVVVTPPAGGWSAGDVVSGAKGQAVDLHFQVELPSYTDLALSESWSVHCQSVCNHDFSSTVNMSDAARDVHITFADASAANSDQVEVEADAELKILSWTFDLASIGAGAYKVLVPPLESADAQSREVIHNNGPYGPVDVAKTITAWANSGCILSYNVSGEEASINGSPPPAPGTEIVAPYPQTLAIVWNIDDLAVSDNLAESELWDFGIVEHQWECNVNFTKALTGAQGHVNTGTGASSASRTVTVCADTDSDGVPDFCLGERDNCVEEPNPDQADSDGDGVGDVCDVDRGAEVKYCLKFGPAPVNISDTQGKYMWTVCEIGNTGSYDELVTIDLSVTGVPAACLPAMEQQLILPGSSTFVLLENEQKFLLWRNRFECHAPAAEGIHPLTVKVCIDPQPQDVDYDNDGLVGEDPIDGVDNDGDSFVDENPPDDNPPPYCEQQIRTLIVHIPSP